ncbi:MAG TPA: DUF721 domain-containing protein [Candidatus Omnitrophica bacterium]|nr:DUF721 domain-containing protein [Candidatus Omnitrophota bacterium]
MKQKKPEHLSKILKKVWSKIEKRRDEAIELSQIFDSIKELLGPELSTHIHTYHLYRKRLILEVDAPIYLQELLFKKEAILYSVNRYLGREVVENITLRVNT